MHFTGNFTHRYRPAFTSVNMLTPYTSFGSSISEMQYSSDTSKNYRYGFNAQEKDNEIASDGDYYSFKYRVHDTRLGRFLSVDPLSAEYLWNSTYAYAENRVIDGIDLEGCEWLSAKSRVYVSGGLIKAWVANIHAPLVHYFDLENCGLVGLKNPISNQIGTIEFKTATIKIASVNPPDPSASVSQAAEKRIVKETKTISPLTNENGQATASVVSKTKIGIIDLALGTKTTITSKQRLGGGKLSVVNGVVEIAKIGLEYYAKENLKNEVNALCFEANMVEAATSFLIDKVVAGEVLSSFCNDNDLSEILNVMLTGTMPPGFIENSSDAEVKANNERFMKIYNLGWKFIKDAGQDPAAKAQAAGDKIKETQKRLDENTTDNTRVPSTNLPARPR